MTWTFVFSTKAEKQFKKLDGITQSRIKKALTEKLMADPTLTLEPLTGDKAGFYKFRIGNYRLLCSKNDETFCILIFKVKHRREVYRDKS
ncbi:MAG: type II toxin-antitoxin system RelE family toxin [Candidatus Puniceispirillales bacterium WSBS_2018_MAG_OTU23]